MLIVLNIEANLPKLELRTNLLISHKNIPPKCPFPWLYSGIQSSSLLYGIKCTVHSVIHVQIVASFFDHQDWQSLHKCLVSMTLSTPNHLKRSCNFKSISSCGFSHLLLFIVYALGWLYRLSKHIPILILKTIKLHYFFKIIKLVLPARPITRILSRKCLFAFTTSFWGSRDAPILTSSNKALDPSHPVFPMEEALKLDSLSL